MMGKSSELGYLNWVEPTYLNIQWPKDQFLPEPNKEIGHDEFMRLMFCGASGLRGTNYGQLYLEDKAHKVLWPDECRSCKEKYQYSFAGNECTTVATEQAEQIGVDGIFPKPCKRCNAELRVRSILRARIGEVFGGLWAVHFFFFSDYALAVGERYVSTTMWMNTGKRGGKNVPRDLGIEAQLGSIIPQDGHYAHILRFWRIGCQHKNMKTYWKAMHDRHDECPDCGFHAQYDTSG